MVSEVHQKMDNCIRTPKELSFDGNLEENWKNWLQSFELFLYASEKYNKDDKIKCALLLHCAGEKAIEIYNSFTFTNAEKDKYDVLIEKFKTHMAGKKDVSYERTIFNSRIQKEDELFANYLAALQVQAKKCEYENLVDGIVRDRIVQGIRSKKTKEKLMSTRDLTLEKSIDICKVAEINELRLNEMREEEKKVKLKQ